MNFRVGFTLIEVIMVIAIAGVLSAITVTGFRSFGSYFALRAATQDVHTALIDARGATLASKNDTIHGVHIADTEVVRFEGASYVPGAASNIAFPFSPGVTATSSLSSGGTDVVFTRLTGSAQSSGTIMLIHADSGASTTITVQSSGIIEL